MTLMQTTTGHELRLDALAADDVSLVDVAHQLARLCRFNGCTRVFYSVAQHSVLVSRELTRQGRGPATQLLGLLHDAHEAYLGDWILPLKQLAAEECPPAREWMRRTAHRVQAAIELALLPHAAEALIGAGTEGARKAVEHADLVLLATERRDLLTPTRTPWPVLHGIAPHRERIEPATWQQAAAEFLTTYQTLHRECERMARHV